MFTAALITIAKYGSNPSAHQLMNGKTKCAAYKQWNIILPFLKREENFDICYNMNEISEYYAK